MLTNGGITNAAAPDSQHLQLSHVWVEVTIAGTTYILDPSFKNYLPIGGIGLSTIGGTAMGYVQNTFLNDPTVGALNTATIGTSPASVQSVNRANVRNNLLSYSTNLVDYIQNTYNTNPSNSAATIDDILGGKKIAPRSGSFYWTTTANPPPYTFVGSATSYTTIPASLKVQLSIQWQLYACMSLQSDQQAPDGSINSLIKKYQTCDTYADRGEITLDTDGTVTGTIRFNTEFSRSRGFELTWLSHFGTLTSAKYVLRKTQHRVTVESYDTVKSYHSLYEALAGHAGTSRRLTLLVPGLLITRKDEPDAGVWLDWATRLLSGLHHQSPVSTDTNLVKLQNASFDSSVIIDTQNIILKAVELRRSRNLRKKQAADQDVESIFEDTSANTIERSSYIYEFAKFT